MLRFLFTLLFLSSIFAPSFTQERPKVGLVLSGGAAHGLAHIGVIKYLEELGIKIDYITGTSMGAVIGGLSAMGFDSDQIRDVAGSQNWRLLMSNKTPLYEVAPIEKAHHERIPLSIYWKDDSFKLPQGIIRGQKLDIILSNIYAPAYQTKSFSDFHKPFKCVAIDIEDGSIKVFEDGYLGEAVRASMSIPTVFPPSNINDRLYVDGGLIRNFPVEECLAMGADYIIGVYVGSEKKKKKDLKSMLDVLKQSAAMASMLDSEGQSKLADIIIHPDVKDMGTFDFDNFDEFIEKGYDAARDYDDELKKLANRLRTFPQVLKNDRIEYPLKIKVDELNITETDPVLRKMISNKLGFSPGHFITLKELEESLSLIYGTKNFSKANYSFDYTGEKPCLKVITEDVEPYSVGISLNRFKHYNASFIINAEARNLFGKPSNFRIDARISENPGLQAEYYVRIPKVPSFLVRLSGKYERYILPIYRGKVVDRLYNTREGRAKMELLYESENALLVSASLDYRFDGLLSEVFKANDFNKYKTNKINASLGFEYNTLDSKVFPETGLSIETTAGHIFNNKLVRENQSETTTFLNFQEDKNYAYAQVAFKAFLHSSTLICSEFYVNARYANGKSFLDSYRIGGPIQSKGRTFGFVGVDDSELLVDNHIALKYGLRLHASEVIYITPVVQYIYGRNLLSYAFDEVDYEVSLLSFGVVLGINSPIGPLTFDLGYSGLRDRLVVNLGIGFRHIF